MITAAAIAALRAERDRLEAEVERLKRLVMEPSEAEAALFDAKAEVMKWQTYMAWVLAFASDQHAMHVAEVAAFPRASATDRLAGAVALLREADEYMQHLYGCAVWQVDDEGTRQVENADCTCGMQRLRDSLPIEDEEHTHLGDLFADALRWRWMFPDSPLVSVTERMQRVYRKWSGEDSWNDFVDAAIDAARRAGKQ